MKEKAVLVCKESAVKELFDELGTKVLAENNLFVKVLPDHLFSTLFEINTNKVDVDMSDEVFKKIALMAQENNITFDMQVSDILKKQIDEKKEEEPLKWRLPSRDELDLMYENLHKKSVGGFTDNMYLSFSTFFVENTNISYVLIKKFSSGYVTTEYRDSHLWVRAVRSFKIEEGEKYSIGQETPTGFVFDIQRDIIFECKKEDEPDLMTWQEARDKLGS